MTDFDDVKEVVAKIRQLLAGHSAGVQGAVLADLLAIWLAGHEVTGDADATRRMRSALLSMHCAAVRNLTAVNAKLLGTCP